MNTPAHMALCLAVLGRNPRRGDWWAILVGAVLPDLLLYVGHFMRGADAPGLIAANAVIADLLNSALLYAVALAVGWRLGHRLTMLVAASALLHIALDLPLHHADAHAHFYPVTAVVFVSPFSFWDADHFGQYLGVAEGILFAACFVVIWRRLESHLQRAAAVAFALVYVATFVHFVGHVWADAHWAVW